MKKINSIMKTQVMGEDWEIFLATPGYFNRKLKLEGEHYGYSEPNLKHLYFNKKSTSFDTTLHELIHAYNSYFISGEISLSDFEELSVDYISRNIFKILYQAQIIYNKITIEPNSPRDMLHKAIDQVGS